jgi:hypothetical protein
MLNEQERNSLGNVSDIEANATIENIDKVNDLCFLDLLWNYFYYYKKQDLDNRGKMWDIALKMYKLRKKSGTINKEKRLLKEEIKSLHDKIDLLFKTLNTETKYDSIEPEIEKIIKEIRKNEFLLNTYKMCVQYPVKNSR